MTKPWAATVLTIFPEMFPGPLGVSLSGKALDRGVWSLKAADIRNFGLGAHRAVDDTPAGGGPGMVMRADVVAAALDHTVEAHPDVPAIYLSPRGTPLTQTRVRKLADGPGAILLCGRFEGLDERVLEARPLEEISVGDFVLSGGEVAAMALLEAVVRLMPGVMGDAGSLDEESFENGLLEYPHYTRPQEWEGRTIPPVLLSGHHQRIAQWRRARSQAVTKRRRPDLWAAYEARKGRKSET